MEQKFIILCHLLNGYQYLYKDSFDSKDSALETLKQVCFLPSFDDVVLYEIIDVFCFSHSVLVDSKAFKDFVKDEM